MADTHDTNAADHGHDHARDASEHLHEDAVRLKRVQLRSFERSGEVLSGAFIALIAEGFWV